MKLASFGSGRNIFAISSENYGLGSITAAVFQLGNSIEGFDPDISFW